MTTMEAVLATLRGLLLLAEFQAFGALVVAGWIGDFPVWRVLRPAFVALAILGPAWFVVQALAIGDASSIALVLEDTVVGHSFVLRALAWGACLVVARRHAGWAILPAGVAVGLHGLVGHAAASGETLLQVSVVLHLLAAAAWLGGLLPLYLTLRGDEPTRVALRFSWLGAICVPVLLATAFVQAQALAGGMPGLVGTDFGRILLLKLALLAGLLVLAFRNRFVLTPRLSQAPRALDASLMLEITLGAVLLGAAALLASLPPGAHEQPNWPFALRPSLDVLADDDLRAEIGHALLALALAGALLFAATLHRFLRVAAPLAALAIAWFAVPSLMLLLVPAEPTYYWQSPSLGDAPAIERGRIAFVAHCVGCHGATGAGDGPRAASLSIPPADLTAAHLWEHSDGELFWWISEGMRAPDGSLVMPGAKATLSEQTCWELIDFIHANNATGTTLPRAVHHH